MWHLNTVDYIILIVFFLSLLTGLLRGFVKEVISLISLIVAIIVATTFSNSLAMYFTHTPTVQTAVNQAATSVGPAAAQSVSYIAVGASFALLFMATMFIGAIVGLIINAAFQSGMIGMGNRLLGALFGFVRAYMLTLVAIFLVQLTYFSDESLWRQSRLVPLYQPSVEWLARMVSPGLVDLKTKLQKVTSGLQGLTDAYKGAGTDTNN